MKSENNSQKMQMDLEIQIELYKHQLELVQKETEASQKEIDYMRNMIYEMQIEQEQIHRSFSWKITLPFRICGSIYQIFKNPRALILRIRRTKYLSAARYLIPKKIRARMVKKYFEAYNSTEFSSNSVQENQVLKLLKDFEQELHQQDRLILVFSGVKYVDHEGQRNIRLIHEAREMGIKIIFAYWRWNSAEEIEESEEALIKIPIDILNTKKIFIFENYFRTVKNKCFLIEFPHPCAVQMIEIANSFGWKSIYDAIDDWKEFSQCGQAEWYEQKVEKRIANIVDVNIATANVLKEKIEKDIVVKKPYYLISNGVDTQRIRKSKKISSYDFTKGNLQIGYFGHLTDAWFDWQMLIRLARKHSDWTFHIIGYGAPQKLKVPENIILYGKKRPEELSKYAAFWDVSIIPFRNNELTRGVNPIKVFEYLQLRMPVVASYMPEIENYPYVTITRNEEEFEQAVLSSRNVKLDEQCVQQFINKNTWKQKCLELIECIDSVKKISPFKYFEL